MNINNENFLTNPEKMNETAKESGLYSTRLQISNLVECFKSLNFKARLIVADYVLQNLTDTEKLNIKSILKENDFKKGLEQ